MSEVVRQLKIKTNSVQRMGKDLDASAKEMARQEKRIEEYKKDPERDEYDVKKQVEVLGEYQAGRTDEFDRLKKYRNDLHVFLEQCADSAEWAEIKDVEEVAKAKEIMKEADDRLANK